MKLIKKLFQFLLFFSVIQVSYFYVTQPNFYELARLRDFKSQVKEGINTLFLCDSTSYTYSILDKDRRSTTQLIQESLRDQKLTAVCQGGYHLGVFHTMVETMLPAPTSLNTVVMNLNLGSFSPNWLKRPSHNFSSDILGYRWGKYPLALPFLHGFMVFKAFNLDPIKWKDFPRVPVTDGDMPAGTMADYLPTETEFSETDSKKRFQVAYLPGIHADHELLSNLRQTNALLKNAGIKLFTYINPIDAEEGTRLLGPHFVEQVEKNLGVIKAVLKEEEIPFIDLTFTVPSEDFAWNGIHYPGNRVRYADEHLTEKGRAWVANNVASFLRSSGHLNLTSR